MATEKVIIAGRAIMSHIVVNSHEVFPSICACGESFDFIELHYRHQAEMAFAAVEAMTESDTE